MAMLISRASGNFTSSSTWGVADSATGSQLLNYSASTNTTTSYVYSNAFTGTNTRVADGIVFFLKRLNTTGTVTVALSDDNGVTATRSVTVNASDLPADESWVFFKFGSTLTLDGGTDYRVGVVASDADNALIYRDSTAGNWARMVSTTLTGAPAAGDTMLIVGELAGAGASSSYTVTMDNTNSATDFGTNANTSVPTSQTSANILNGIQIGQNGTLTWATSGATNYYLKLSGHLMVWSGGTYNMGTSGTPCPRDSTMTLQFDSTGTSSSSYGLATFNGSVINIYGQSRTAGKDIFYCNLTANAAANATSLSVDTDTGWLDNDQICISATNRIVTEDERGTLNGNAGASTLTVDGFGGTAGGLAFSHDGTGIACAVVCLLTRNVKITGTNNGGFVICRGTSAVNFRWAEFTLMSGQSSAGVGMPATSGINIQYCSFHTSTAGALMGGSTGVITNATLSNNVIYNFGDNLNISSGVSVGSTGNVISNSFFIKPVFSSCCLIQGANYHFTMSNCFFSGATNNGLLLSAYNSNQQVLNCRMQCCGTGVNITTSSTLLSPATISGITIARCTTNGISVNGNLTITFENLLIVGCTTNSFNYTSFQGSIRNIVSCTMTGESAYSTVNNINIPNNSFAGIINITNCNFSLSSGSYAPATNDISIGTFSNPMITASNTLFGAATETLNPSNMGAYGFVKSSKHDQTEGAFKSWFSGGVIERDTTIFNTAAPSERLTPISATTKLASGPRLVAVDDGSTITINAYVRKSATGDGAAYNGNQPRLIVRANLACGITTDTVLDTMTVGTGTWEQLTGTTAAVDADGVLEFYVDCDGTAGWINVDDWSVS